MQIKKLNERAEGERDRDDTPGNRFAFWGRKTLESICCLISRFVLNHARFTCKCQLEAVGIEQFTWLLVSMTG